MLLVRFQYFSGKEYTNEEDANASCCGDARAHRIWRTNCSKGEMLCAMPTMSGSAEGVL
jgi:hypothetical protein